MENQRQRWVNIVFTGVAILVGIIASVGFTKLSSIYSWESSLKSIDLVITLVSIVVGAAVGFGLYFSDQTNAFMNEVVLELGRVTWPTQNETVKATIMVLIFVLIAGLVLGGFDSLWTWAMKLVL